MRIAEKIQSIPCSKQSKYFGKSWARLVIGILCISAVIGMFVYSMVEQAKGPTVKQIQITDQCGRLTNVAKYDRCVCETTLRYGDILTNKSVEQVMNASWRFMPFAYAQKYNPDYMPVDAPNTLAFFAALPFKDVEPSSCIHFPTATRATHSIGCSQQPAILDNSAIDYCNATYLQCKQSNVPHCPRPQFFEDTHLAYWDWCTLSYEDSLINGGGVASVYRFQKILAELLDVLKNTPLTAEELYNWKLGRIVPSISGAVYSTILTALLNQNIAAIMIPPQQYITDQIIPNDICMKCGSMTCTGIEEITVGARTIAAFSFAGGFISIFFCIGALTYDTLSSLAVRFGDVEIDYAVEGIREKTDQAEWSLW